MLQLQWFFALVDAIQGSGSNMNNLEKIALSAVIGGSAEALGGGKFANGAVTGAYVILFSRAATLLLHKIE
ncbi:MAG TPA: hypothetical protein VK172_10675 [Lentimicrobium sp.]|nr:hypothetical protein [Lentimicrobium sp.]